MAEEESSNSELPLDTAGTRLRRAREAAGLSMEDIAARTKIAERHIAAIEEDRFSDLAGKTYAVGFSRSFARAVGLDEAEIAQAVRDQLAAEAEEYWPTPKADTFEPGDPARVPPARLAWIAGLGVLIVLGVVYLIWKSFLSPAGSMPDLLEEEQPEAVASAAPDADARAEAPAAGGPVVFTSLESDVWVKIYDASGRQLFQKQMNEGESYTVPADAEGPQIWTGRPDALRITVAGREVPKLADEALNIRDVPISAAALLARGEQGDAPSARPAAAPAATSLQPRPSPEPTATLSSPRPTPSRAMVAPSPQASPTRTATAPSPRPTATVPAPRPTTRVSSTPDTPEAEAP